MLSLLPRVAVQGAPRLAITTTLRAENSVLLTRAFSLGLGRANSQYKDELTAKQIQNDNPFDTYVLKPEPGRGFLKEHEAKYSLRKVALHHTLLSSRQLFDCLVSTPARALLS